MEINNIIDFMIDLKGIVRNIGKTNIITLSQLDELFVKHKINLRELEVLRDNGKCT